MYLRGEKKVRAMSQIYTDTRHPDKNRISPLAPEIGLNSKKFSQTDLFKEIPPNIKPPRLYTWVKTLRTTGGALYLGGGNFILGRKKSFFFGSKSKISQHFFGASHTTTLIYVGFPTKLYWFAKIWTKLFILKRFHQFSQPNFHCVW